MGIVLGSLLLTLDRYLSVGKQLLTGVSQEFQLQTKARAPFSSKVAGCRQCPFFAKLEAADGVFFLILTKRTPLRYFPKELWEFFWKISQANIYLFKVNNRNTKKVANSFKVNNKDARTTSLTSFCYLYC